MNRFKFLLFLFLLPYSLFASVADTTKKIYSSNVVRWLVQSDTHADTLTFHGLDTTAKAFQNFNPVFSNTKDNARIYLGNLGTATKSIAFQDPMGWGFDMGRHSFDPYLKQIDDLKFYRTLSPYTRLYYIWNRKKEQLFQFEFSQNIGPRFNYAVNFTRMVSVGDYGRQETDHLNYDANIWYTSKNRRYQVFAAVINSSLVIQENGGIKSDSIFRVTSNLNSEFEPVYLNNASNRISDKQYFLKQTYAFGKKDTLKLDTMKIERIRPSWRIFNEIRVNNRKDEFRETPLDSGVYSNIYKDSTTTNDYYSLKHFQTRLGVENYRASKKSNRMNSKSLYGRLDAIDYQNSNLLSISVFAEHLLQLSTRTEWSINIQQGIVGDYSDNTLLQTKLNYYSKNDSSKVSIAYLYSNRDADFTSKELVSNHYIWYNYSFNDVKHSVIKLNYTNDKRKFYVGISLGNVANKVYYDTTLTARQLSKYQYAQLQLQKNFQFNWLHITNQITVQGNTEQDIVRMPLVHTYQSIFLQSNVFKKAMNIRTGFDVRYYTKTESFDYNAATSQFYLSNKSIGDYPIIDFFLTASLKRAVLMMKIDHLNQGFWNKGYYMVDGYPLPDRVLKIGLRWAFYD